MSTFVVYGNFIFTISPHTFVAKEKAYLVIENGVVLLLADELPEQYEGLAVMDFSEELIIPGFCDLHTHAPQFVQCGLGYDEELLPWLTKYTFPLESRFSDLEFADRCYREFIRALWVSGTTRASVFGTLHPDTTLLLFDLLVKSGLGGMVGKVNMDRNSIPELSETTAESLRDTELFLSRTFGRNNRVTPILTPRFVPSTTRELMRELGHLAETYNLPIQSHVSENRDEVAWVRELHPEIETFSEVYEAYGLLRPEKTVLAHAIYLTEKEKILLQERKIYLAHCPLSNINMRSGIMPLRDYMRRDMRLGIGSDVAGSHRLDIMSSIAGACQQSNLRFIDHPEDIPVSLSEAFYLATKGGGKFFGRVGSFEPGYDADFLVINKEKDNVLLPRTLEERLSQFIYSADTSSISKRFVQGREITCPA